MHIHVPWILELPEVKHDRELEEFLRGEKHCQNFINQDLTFLQPSIIHSLRTKVKELPPEEDTAETVPIETLENIQINTQTIMTPRLISNNPQW